MVSGTNEVLVKSFLRQYYQSRDKSFVQDVWYGETDDVSLSSSWTNPWKVLLRILSMISLVSLISAMKASVRGTWLHANERSLGASQSRPHLVLLLLVLLYSDFIPRHLFIGCQFHWHDTAQRYGRRWKQPNKGANNFPNKMTIQTVQTANSSFRFIAIRFG